LISVSQRRGPREHIYLIILAIPLVALAIDRLLYHIQRSLFPYRYGGPGYLNNGLKWLLHRWDDIKVAVLPSHLPAWLTAERLTNGNASSDTKPTDTPPGA